MELDKLRGLRELNELDLVYRIFDICKIVKEDAEKVLKGNDSARIRIRSQLQDVRLLCEIIREKTQIRKGINRSSDKVNSLEREILLEEKNLAKSKDNQEKKKQERLARFQRKVGGQNI